MRLVKILIIVLLLPVGFAGGYLAGGVSGSPQPSAGSDKLQQAIIQDLQSHYYKAVDVSKLRQSGITGMLKSLKDRWTEYLSPAQVKLLTQELGGTYSGIGASLEKKGSKLLITSVFKGSPAQEAGLKAGDQVISANGTATAGLSVEANIANVKGPAGTTVVLVVRSAGSSVSRTVSITRRNIDLPLTVHRMLRAGKVPVGYVELSIFAGGAGKQVHDAVQEMIRKGARWIIFDLRENPGGLLTESVNVAGDFLPKGDVVVSTKGLHAPKTVLRVNSGLGTTLPMVVLVDGMTASSSEIVSGALQDYKRAFIVGTRTFGKGLVQTTVPTPGGGALKLTIAVYLTPKGRDINLRGIQPDKVVSDNLKTKADEVLQAALKYIASQ